MVLYPASRALEGADLNEAAYETRSCDEIVERILKVLNDPILKFFSPRILMFEIMAFQTELEKAGLPPEDVGGVAYRVWEKIMSASNRTSPPVAEGGMEAVAKYVDQFLDPEFLADRLRKMHGTKIPGFVLKAAIRLARNQLTRRFEAKMDESGLRLEHMRYIGQQVYNELVRRHLQER